MSELPPIPPPERPDPERPIDQQNLRTGGKEQELLASRFAELEQGYQKLRKFFLKPALFLFVLAINWWWDKNVLLLLWQAGRANSGFHLADSVLIALITTSIANFLVLVHIVAKNLFPSRTSQPDKAPHPE